MENIASLVFAVILGLFRSCTVLQAFWKWKLQFRVFSWDAFIEGLRPRQLWQVTDWNIKLPNIQRKESCSSSCLSPFPWQTQIHDPPPHSIATQHTITAATQSAVCGCVSVWPLSHTSQSSDPAEMDLIIDETITRHMGLMNASPCWVFGHVKCCDDDPADV